MSRMKSGLTVKIIIFLMLSDVLETLTHFFFKKGALSQGEVNIDSFLSAKGFIFGVFSSPYLWGIISCFLPLLSGRGLIKIDLCSRSDSQFKLYAGSLNLGFIFKREGKYIKVVGGAFYLSRGYIRLFKR